MFALISFLIASFCLLKGVIALWVPEQFYRWRSSTQYQSESIPPTVLVVPLIMSALALLAWYATFTRYQPWSWIVTGFTTLITFLAIANLSRWSAHRRKVGTLIETEPQKRMAVDIVLVVIGVVFLGLGLFVY